MKKGKNAAYVACMGGCRAVGNCRYGCAGDGRCLSACKFGAIFINDYGVAEVNEEKCVGCGMCVCQCPKGILRLHERGNNIVVKCANEDTGKDTRAVCEVGCIGCGICERICPSGAAKVEKNLSRLDDDLCLSCGQCLVACPRGCIADVRGILTK